MPKGSGPSAACCLLTDCRVLRFSTGPAFRLLSPLQQPYSSSHFPLSWLELPSLPSAPCTFPLQSIGLQWTRAALVGQPVLCYHCVKCRKSLLLWLWMPSHSFHRMQEPKRQSILNILQHQQLEASLTGPILEMKKSRPRGHNEVLLSLFGLFLQKENPKFTLQIMPPSSGVSLTQIAQELSVCLPLA